jgi:GGDEF domain-containing protein
MCVHDGNDIKSTAAREELLVMYSHDGIRDSLTQLAAPTLLYEELRRELARAKREDQPITMIRFLLAPPDRHRLNWEADAYSQFEKTVINFAQTLTQLSRGEDVCARMGELEFICILRGVEEAGERFVSRISLRWREAQSKRGGAQAGSYLQLEAASLVSKPSESALDFLNRLDREPTTAG